MPKPTERHRSAAARRSAPRHRLHNPRSGPSLPTGLAATGGARPRTQDSAGLRALALACALGFAGSAGAAQWDITPRFSAGEIYSDNINLAPVDEIGDFITEVTPGISVRGAGARLQMNVDYNLQNLFYASESERDAMNHQLQANSGAELVENIVFVDAHALMTQALVDPAAPLTNSNISGSGNRADALIYGVEPYVRHHFGAWADAEARLNYEKTTYEQNAGVAGSNSTLTGNVFSLSSGRRFQRVQWTATYDNQTTDYDAGSETEFKHYGVDFGVALRRQWRLDASVGHETNSYGSIRSRDTGGFMWTLGGAWTPSPRTEVAFGTGDRYFGTNYYFSARHERRRLVFTASYREDPYTASSALAQQQLVPLVDARGQPVFDPNQASRIPLSVTTPRLDDDVYINSEFDMGVAYAGQRSSAQLSVYDISRDYETRLDNEDVQGFSVSWSRSLSTRSGTGISFSRSEEVLGTNAIETTSYSLSPYLSYQFGRSLSGILRYQHYRSESDSVINNYRENQISAFVNVAL